MRTVLREPSHATSRPPVSLSPLPLPVHGALPLSTDKVRYYYQRKSGTQPPRTTPFVSVPRLGRYLPTLVGCMPCMPYPGMVRYRRGWGLYDSSLMNFCPAADLTIYVAPHAVTIIMVHTVDSVYMSFNCTTRSNPRGPTPPSSCAIDSIRLLSSGSQAVPLAVPAAAGGPESCDPRAKHRGGAGKGAEHIAFHSSNVICVALLCFKFAFIAFPT